MNKMIFDCLNEVLDGMRIGGTEGELLPHKFLWTSF